MYNTHIHARSLDSRGGEDRAWVKQFWSGISYEIPEGWRVCGENLWAEHSIHYDALPSYFMGFSVWNSKNQCLSWDDTLLWFNLLGITPVPVLYDGVWNETVIRQLWDPSTWDVTEGYVVRVADQYDFSQFKTSVAKFVRRGHVQTAKHWRAGRQFIQNGKQP